jgi:iron(III) transport system ATP-binding protein
MSDQIVVMRRGHIEQNGSPGEIYNFPRTEFVADFVGSANLIAGRLRPDLSKDGLVVLEADGGHILHGVSHGRAPRPNPVMSVRTVHLRLTAARVDAAVNVWPVVVRRTVFLGDMTQVHVEWGGRELVVRQTTADGWKEGDGGWLSIAPGNCVLLEPE